MVRGELRTIRVTLESAGGDAGVLGYVYVRDTQPGQVTRTGQIAPGVNADYDADGQVLGLEFLEAEKADTRLLHVLAKTLGIPELAGLDLAEMCRAPLADAR